MTRDELIAALEKATGPNRELDAAIARIAGWGCVMRDPQADHNWYCWRKEYRSGVWIPLSLYTASIDAALTLVPEGMRRRTVVYEDGRAGVQLWWPTEPLPDVGGKPTPANPSPL